MAERQVFGEHPRKVRVEGYTSEQGLTSDAGWVNMDVKFVISATSGGSEQTVFGITIFPPGAKHDIHRHPNAEEVEYIVEGHGIARVGDDDVKMGPGEVVVVRRNEYHGFENTSQTDRAVMIWCYSGAASLEQAGYVTLAEDQRARGA